MAFDRIELKEMKKSGDVEGLLSILGSNDSREVLDAVRILGEMGSRKAIGPLIGLLEKDNIQVRANAAWALGEIGSAKAVLPLIGLLNDPTENVRIYAAWSLGRIGDRRAVQGLKAVMGDASSELRKHIKEALVRIGSNKRKSKKQDDTGSFDDREPFPSEPEGISLLKIDVPSDTFDCDYVTRVEGSQKNHHGFSKDITIKDTDFQHGFSRADPRKIILGLRDEFKGLVSVDILFRYIDYMGDEKQTSSVWLQMVSRGEDYVIPDRDNLIDEEIDYDADWELEEEERREMPPARRVVTRKHHARRAHEIEVDEYPGFEETGYDNEIDDSPYFDEPSFHEEVVPEYVPQKKVKKNRFTAPDIQEPVEPAVDPSVPSDAVPDIPEPVEPVGEPSVPPDSAPVDVAEKKSRKKKSPAPDVQEPVEPASAPSLQEEVQDVPGTEPLLEDTGSSETLKEPEEVKKTVETEIAGGSEPEVAASVEDSPVQLGGSDVDVGSAVNLLNDIGMAGMANAASTVTQLSGEDAESLQSQLATLPIDEMNDEIMTLGESVVLIDVNLHGSGEAGNVNGRMQLYISNDTALRIANELLCIPPDEAINEFNEDIISTLKETVNIFGGQYVSAISEYIEIPIFLEAPGFQNGDTAGILESVKKDIDGEIEFALSTIMPLGSENTGKLIMLLDTDSFNIIISKLF